MTPKRGGIGRSVGRHPLAVLALTLLAPVAAGQGPTALAPGSMPGPSPRGHTDPGALNATCVGCHAAVAEEWQVSSHRAAFRDPSFSRAFLREPLPFCQGCHAPEAPTTRRPEKAEGDMGVACVTCHVVGGKILAAPRGEGDPTTPAPHAVTRDPNFSSDAACGSCHEFNFPDGRSPMQSTVREHRASRAAGTSCAGCHMPSAAPNEPGGGPHRSHAFSVTENVTRLRSALSVVPSRPSPTRVAITLSPKAVGHAVPTGDLFRRLAIYVRVLDAEGRVTERQARFLSRHFAPRPTATGALAREEIGDDRVGALGPVPTQVLLPVQAAGKRVTWMVVYERVQHFRSMDEDDAEVTEAVTLFEGELGP